MFRGVLSNGLPFLRPVMLVSTMCGDRAQVSNEGKADEELHVVKDGHRDGQALRVGRRQHKPPTAANLIDAHDWAAQYGITFPRLLPHVLIPYLNILNQSSSGPRLSR